MSDFLSVETKQTARELSKCIQTQHEIECDTCGAGDYEEGGSDWSAAVLFAQNGWEIDANGYARCKECNEKAK